jgi:hypothetical protein
VRQLLAASGPPSNSGANASQKLRCIDWFFYVVVCPKVKQENPLCRLTRTQHKERNILRFSPNLPTETLDRLSRKSYIENDKIGFGRREDFPYCYRNVRNGDHVVAGWH